MEYENKFGNRKTPEEESKADPLGFLAMSLNEGSVHVKVRGESASKEMKGKLIAFDEHLNLMMTDCEEKITTIINDPVSGKDIPRVKKVQHSMIFIRGDLVITISPSHSLKE